jgi:hypothetical protein
MYVQRICNNIRDASAIDRVLNVLNTACISSYHLSRTRGSGGDDVDVVSEGL